MTLFRLLSLAILISPMVDAMSDELQPNFQMSSIGEVRTAPDDGISGRYQLSSEQAGDSSEMTLECADENACTLSTTLHSQGHLSVDVRRLHMSLVQDLGTAKQALQYVLAWKDRTLRSAHNAAKMILLLPMLNSNPKISRCWDANYHGPGFLLVCKIRNSADNYEGVYLFGTLLINSCGEAFCRYVIEPMRSVK
ncbi:MAG: hypothetical protein GTN84_18615 [Hydrogenophaga sp.]|uniref:hypothetical protein n=1 Tax=Hydrogenophaga sp. TaxID=1904254 RepID=UPI0016B56E99|nr:hypothetical protein [Hydrogenophaga sp.]NIM43258.1 hypothetical protein [Hydrogenophaga sp.]NIN28326.1 hypothetical protein [Hydrogenophaga sp.]NIN29145.1 hypothetical protein [Hydrogenophaga sp.]NIN57461.1 hypothetical protein [Hydrogenophaga sp.]NIO53756.1 hypothetical protein [Hydrogenophaga sp.]